MRASMSILFRTKTSLTVGQLVPAWACELATTEQDRTSTGQNLWLALWEDIINGRLDEIGASGERRPGLRLINEAHRAGFIRGDELRELTPASPSEWEFIMH